MKFRHVVASACITWLNVRIDFLVQTTFTKTRSDTGRRTRAVGRQAQAKIHEDVLGGQD
jgi:hypothetical protein